MYYYKNEYFLAKLKSPRKKTRIFIPTITMITRLDSMILAAILASGKYGHVYLELSFQFT